MKQQFITHISSEHKLFDLHIKETLQYRDVYADQQLDRSSVADAKSPTSRIVITVILTVLFFFVGFSNFPGTGNHIAYPRRGTAEFGGNFFSLVASQLHPLCTK